MSSDEVVHPDPVWRSRANFIVAASIDSAGTSVKWEQLWTKQLSSTKFQICCIPFFAYDLALGDAVEVDGDYVVRRVVTPSGRFVFRVVFSDPGQRSDDLITELVSDGVLVERYSTRLVALDAADEAMARKVASRLAAEESAGTLVYETGRLSPE